MIALAVLRHDQRLADMAGGDNISESTVRRWRDEAIGLLAAQAPRLDRACKKNARQGGEVVLIDGTLIPTQRRTGKADRKNYSGKHRHHGLHFLALTVERAPVEHGFAHLKNWRILAKLRTGPAHATQILRALLVLTNLEVNR
ncbi:hypothetical protein [Streptomyces sp. AC627_RSS907]|uniref:hypothetical protein n=1 Tax=Streptomyces sp. AC627_RSS907 TaxID=2823684 RepID=UPI0020B6CC97|nr:hypothetical protein [Streptomyces sp. AC627_RSS907]